MTKETQIQETIKEQEEIINKLKERIVTLTNQNTDLELKLITIETQNLILKKRIQKEFHNEKKIIAFLENGETKEFKSVTQASQELGIAQPTISSCLKSGKASHGYCFDYAM